MVWLLAKLSTLRGDVIRRQRVVYVAASAIWRSRRWEGDDAAAVKALGETAREVSVTPDEDKVADLRRVLRRQIPERVADALRALASDADAQSYVTLITASVAGFGEPEAGAIRSVVTWEEVERALLVAVTF